MFIIFYITKKQLLNFRMKVCQSLLLLCIWIIQACIRSRWYNVEFWVKSADAIDNSIQSRHCERLMAFILSYCVLAESMTQRITKSSKDRKLRYFIFYCGEDMLPSSYLLESAGDYEISLIHCYKISGKLTGEVILLIKFLPVNIRVRVFCLLQCMSNCALVRK